MNHLLNPIIIILDMFGTFGIMYLMVEHNNGKYKSFMSCLKRYKLLSCCVCCSSLVQYAMNENGNTMKSSSQDNTTTTVNTSNATSNEMTPCNASDNTPSTGSNFNIEIDDGVNNHNENNMKMEDEESIETKTAQPVLFNHTSSVNSNNIDPSFNEYTQTRFEE